MLSVNVEQNVNVKFCVKLGKSTTGLSHTKVYEWCKRFKDGREDIGDDQRPGRPSTSETDANYEKVGEIFRQNCRLEHSSSC